MTYLFPKPMQIIQGPEIDMLVTGDTVVFESQAPFMALFIYFLGTDVTGTPGVPVFNVGWTAPNYDDFSNGQSIVGAIQGQYYVTGVAGSTFGNPIPLMPAATQLRVNVVTPDGTATTNTQKVYIAGHYL